MGLDGVTQLSAQPLFAGVPEPVLRPLLAASRLVRYLPGEQIFTEGDDADGVYVVAAGVVRVEARGSDRQVQLAIVSAPSLLGEMGVLDGLERSGTATAIDICTLYFIPGDVFLDLLETSSLVTMRLLALLTERLRQTNGRLLDLPAPPLTSIQAP